ncbi:peptide/nickel transport system substrate-binding protein [Mumia flava]|uniref:Peptide/nickel transport system substrate-binding protein n=1 Tax=Mumia flava TaxID=1348852 RepID=A0A0B2BNA1_9ACTN|nr:ABC transporter substrate-binding protein [Mumia flava]PJJ48284.1 peptide/nickel transport system substrate-binding protein [Mumia flava]
MFRRLAGPLAAAALLALSACSPAATDADASGDPVAGGTLDVVRANPFEGFELDKQTLNSSYQISQAVIEPLIRTSGDGTELVPGLATEWTFNDDSTVLTLTLNPDATFSDGSPVTAADVAFSVDVWKQGANYGATYSAVEATKVVDDHTIELHLVAPDTTFPVYLSWAVAGVVPKDFGGRTAQAFWKQPVGAGPYTVSTWSTNGEVVLERSDHYYREDRPYVDEIVSTFASDPNSIVLRLQSGEIDTADEILPVTADSLPEQNVQAESEHLTPLLLMNTQDPALSDPAVRRAIGYAIDYDAIVSTALRGYGVVPTGALPTNSPNWAPPSEPYFSQDAAQAQELLDGASSAPAKLTFTYPNDPSSTLMAQIIQENLAAVGITVDLRSADASTNFASISGGDYQLGIFAYNAISPDVADPAWYVAATSSMFTGAPVDDLIGDLTEYAAAATEDDKKSIVTRMQDRWSEQAPFLALAHISALEAVGDDAHGVDITPWGTYYFDDVWTTE